MIKKFYKKINKKFKEKKGASLAIVIVSLSMLIILGTVFSTLAYQSYKTSYGTMCQQQASYSAKSVLDAVINKFQKDSTFRSKIGQAMKDQSDATNTMWDKIEIDIGGLHSYIPGENGATGSIANDASNTADCKLFASYVDTAKTKIRLTVATRYNGFNSSLSAVVGITNRAAEELSKIMSNTLYITSPIADMMYYASKFDDYQIDGDVYIDAPRGENPYTSIKAMANDGTNVEAYDGHTLEMDIEGRTQKTYHDLTVNERDTLAKALGLPNSTVLDGFKLPKPKYDSDGKLVTIYDSDGNPKPLYGTKSVDGKETEVKVTVKDDRFETYKENGSQHFKLESDNYEPGNIEVDKNGIYQIEYEPLRDTYNHDGTTSGNIKLNALGWPIYVSDLGSPVPARYRLSGMDVDGNWGKHYVYCHKNRENGNDAEKWAHYKVYECHYQETDADGKLVPNGKVISRYILGEKRYQPNHTKGIPDGYVPDVWYAEPQFGYGMEICYPYYHTLDARYHFNFNKSEHEADERIGFGEGQYSPNAIPEKDNNGKIFKRYPIQNLQRKRTLVKKDVPLGAYRYESNPNTWTEVYLRSHYKNDINVNFLNKQQVPIVINGKLKCNTDVLLGLYNRGVDGNGTDHEFITKKDGLDKITPVAFDTPNDEYTIPMYTCLRTSDDIIVNGNVRAENLMCGGTLYALDLDNTDDGKREGCKGNVVLEQMRPIKTIAGILDVSLTTYMEVGKNFDKGDDINKNPNLRTAQDAVVADGYVVIVGGSADISEKVQIYGDIRAGKFKADGTKWGFNGVGTDIPADKYYREDESIPVAPDISKLGTLRGGIYGYSTGLVEERWGKKNRYTLGSGDVVLQKTRVYGNIYATGDVYINNGSHVYGNIYTPGNVYITKGESKIVGRIGDKFDGRSRVLGNIYAGGEVAITGGCEVGEWDSDSSNPFYNSGVYCGGNLYIRGRVNNKNHDAITGDVVVGGDLVICGRETKRTDCFTRLAFHGGNIIVKGNIGNLDTGGKKDQTTTGTYTTTFGVKNGTPEYYMYCGGNINLDYNSAIEKGIDTVYVGGTGASEFRGCWLHAKQTFISGNLKITKNCEYSEGTKTFVLGTVNNPDISWRSKTPTFYSKKTIWPYDIRVNTEKFNQDTKTTIYGKADVNVLNGDNFTDAMIPAVVKIYLGDDYSDTQYATRESKNKFQERKNLKVELMKEYEKALSAKIRDWEAPVSDSLYIDANSVAVKSDTTQESFPKDKDGNYVITKTLMPNKTNFDFVISDNLSNLGSIHLNSGDVLTFDTTKKNLHIKVTGNITIGEGAIVKVNGPNMVNLYVDTSDAQEITFCKNCDVGSVVGVPAGISEKYAGLNIISNKEITMIMQENTSVKTYNYIPNGVLKFDLPQSTNGTAVIAEPQGSFVINRMLGSNLGQMKLWAIKFATKNSPLILDTNTNLKPNEGENVDFSQLEWELISYE